MKVVVALTAAWLVLFCTSIFAVDKKTQDVLVGKWQSTDEKDKGVSLEFTKEGAVKMTFGAEALNFVVEGTYKVIDDKTIEVTMDDMNKKGEKKTEKLSIKSSADNECVLVDGKGKETTLKRIVAAAKQPTKEN